MNQNLLKLLFITVMSISTGWSYAQTGNWSDHPEELSPQENIYTVSTAGQLAWLANHVNEGNTLKDSTIVLGSDIDLAGHNWIPIGKDGKHPFSGSFDGGGYTIANMNISIETSDSTALGGLFGLVSKGGDLKNVGIVSGSINVTAQNAALAGAIVGSMENSGSIENCYSNIHITTEITDPNDSKKNSPRSGGIVGQYFNSPRTGTKAIRYCYSTGAIQSIGTKAATQNGILAGGIAGRIEDVTVEHCFSTGPIRTEGGDNPYAGGIAGQVSYWACIKNSYSTGDITATSTRAANCYAMAGGIAGMLSRGEIENCYATGAIIAENKTVTTNASEVYAGGIVGDLFVGGNVGGSTTITSTVSNCLALNKSLSATTNRATSRVCLSKVVGGYNTDESNTKLENNYASIATLVKGANVLTGKSNDLNGANWTGEAPVFTEANGWLLSNGKLPVLKTSDSSGALGGQTGMETASLLPPAEVTVATVDDFTAALSLDNIKSIRLADGTYKLKEPLAINKSIEIIGSAPEACTLYTTCTIAPDTQANITLQGVTFTEEESNTKTNVAMIGITKPVELILRNVIIDPKQPGSDSDRRAMIGLTETVTSSNIILENTTIYLTKNSQIGLYNQGALCDFRMTNSQITSKENIDNLSAIRGMLTKGAPDCSYTIDHSTVSVGNNFHYAIWTQTPKQHFVINASDIYGWAAFYMQGAHIEGGADEMTLKASESTFTGVGKSGSTNGFGVIVFEATAHSTLELENCTIKNKVIGNTKDYGFIPPFVFQMGGAGTVTDRLSLKPSSDCSVTLTNCTIQNQAEETTPAFIYYGNVFGDSINGYFDYNKNKITADTRTRFLNQDDTQSFLIQNKDTIRNASSSLSHAIAYQDGDNVIPIAYPGDRITARNLSINNALSALNASEAIPIDYIIPDNILIECKDGYLVTGESAANSYAETLTDAPVFWLKREANIFSTQATGDNRLTIASSTTWNNATYANRSVWVKAGAILTINAAQPLDTLFMEEGAQVKTEVDVTARVLQLNNYRIPANRWKAFGFPVKQADQMVVTDADNKVVTISEKGQDGVWFAGLTSTPATFEHKAGFDKTGLIAADKDNVITVTSKTSATEVVSLKKKDEPAAPSDATTFTLIANPNTFDMTLNQTAYVLSDDGKYYERTENPTIPAFSSFILADAETTATLRSFELKGDMPTANTVIPTSGYYVTTRPGILVIHTSEPVRVTIANMKGQVLYTGKVSTDGWQLPVPAGVYAVNGELFHVK